MPFLPGNLINANGFYRGSTTRRKQPRLFPNSISPTRGTRVHGDQREALHPRLSADNIQKNQAFIVI